MKAKIHNFLIKVPIVKNIYLKFVGYLYYQKFEKQFLKIKNNPEKTEIIIFGLKRSGNHAIIDWVRSQLPGTACFFNNLKPGQDINKTREKDVTIIKNSSINYILHSYEDQNIIETLSLIEKDDFRKQIGPSRNSIIIIILRDPLNFFASRIKWKGQNFSENQNLQLEIINRYLEYYNFIENNKFNFNSRIILINYNQWVSNKNYRKKITESLEIPFTDSGFDTVSFFGGGSSFEGQDINATDLRDKVFHRYKEFENHPFMIEIKKDDRILSILNNTFPEIKMQ